MFANMPGPTTIDVAGVSALGQALVYHEGEAALPFRQMEG